MKPFSFLCFVLLFVGLTGCSSHSVSKDEIIAVEKAFEQRALKNGLAEAFWFYADTAAVIKRGKDSLIYGKDAIRNFYSAANFRDVQLKWTPRSVTISKSGDMAHTFGNYIWQSKDSSGNPIEATGVFHTVWKQQSDRSWKYLWD